MLADSGHKPAAPTSRPVSCRRILEAQLTQPPRNAALGHQPSETAVERERAVLGATMASWIKRVALEVDDFLFPTRTHSSPHLGTRRYGRCWTSGLPRSGFAGHGSEQDGSRQQ
jgi:hypothetical protein